MHVDKTFLRHPSSMIALYGYHFLELGACRICKCLSPHDFDLAPIDADHFGRQELPPIITHLLPYL